ncbi:MAG: hypothetical protein ABL973_18690 [Micropepsaceae bacterium]
MGSFLLRPIDAFSAAPLHVKAGVIAAACGLFSVICGFVLYVVFAHMLEHGDVPTKITGVAAGLIISMAVAWTAERLWETIESGEFKVGGRTKRAFITGLSLVVVFELSASAFEDFARELSGDFDGIKRIAASIAGRDEAQADEALGPGESLALLRQLSADATHVGQAGAVPDASAGARVLALISARQRLEIFAHELQPSDETIAQAFFSNVPAFGTIGLRTGSNACVRPIALIPMPKVSPNAALLAPVQPQKIAECRNYLLSLDDNARATRLARAMQNLVGRHDLYDAKSFAQDFLRKPLGLGPEVLLQLVNQRDACDAIRLSSPNARYMLCDEAARRGLAVAGSGKLIAPSDMRALNRDLLASAFPGVIKPLPILWWDMGLMFLMWCTSAMVVGVYLSYLTSAGGTGTSLREFGFRMFIAFCALWVAGLIAAAVITFVRLLPFLWLLMLDPASTVSHAVPGVFNFIPGMVRWLASGEVGVTIPGWISLPALFVPTCVVWARAVGSSGDSSLMTISGMMLLGMVLSAVAPVLDGMVGVVLLLVGAWFVPTFGLAVLAPYLRPGRELPHWWGAVSLLGGLAVAFWVAVVQPDLVATNRGIVALAGLVSAATGALILRRVPMTDLWPLLAITIGLLLLGLSAAFQQLTFAGALKQLHPVAHSEAPVHRPLQISGDDDVVGYLTILAPRQHDEDVPEAFRARKVEDDVSVSLNLELALAGSIGFWLTLSLMVGWALRQGPIKGHEGPDPKVAAPAESEAH